MQALLDTHSFLWWISDDPRLSENARTIIGQRSNSIFLSSASGWEIATKYKIGRLELTQSPKEFVPNQLEKNRISTLPIEMIHCLEVNELPLHHRDPFDRIIISQSRLEKIPIITRDKVFNSYEVETIW